MSDEVSALEQRLRSTYVALTSVTSYGSPPSIEGARRAPSMPKRLLIAGAALLLILAIVGAIAFVKTGSDTVSRLRPTVPPADHPSLFPEVVPHHGPELLLTPRYVPEGYHLLLATGPDARMPGSRAGSSASTTVQEWVKLDAAGAVPLAAFDFTSGPQDLADAQPDLPGAPTIGHQDALTAYGNAEPITVDGHRGVWAEYLQTIAWEQDGRALALSARMDSWTGTWPEHLVRSDLEAMAAGVVRLDDGTYQIQNPVAGYQKVASTLGLTSAGDNERRLVYTDDQGHGFAVQLVDDTKDPPGLALTAAIARLVDVRGQRAVQTQFLNGGDGSGCSQIDLFLCSPGALPGTLTGEYVQWLEPDSTRVTLTGVGIDGTELLRIARSLSATGEADWKQLTDSTASIPCALTARCGAGR